MESLIDRYQNLVYSICYRSVGNSFDAEDLTQYVFLSAYKKLSEFDRNYEKAWLCKIASNRCLDFLKQAGRRCIPTKEEFFLELTGEEFTPEEQYLQSESKQNVYQLCEKLKSPYKEVAIQHFFYEMSVTDLAEKTGKNKKTLQTQIYRAKGMLKKWIEGSG